MRSMEFQYPEDREYFAHLLTDGDEARLESEYATVFDFDHPAIKREAFAKIRRKALTELTAKYGGVCQLRIHPDCSRSGAFEPDHIIPLASNELNKKLRHMRSDNREHKVKRQSFGSNDIRNLTLACHECNNRKRYHILDGVTLQRLLAG